MNLRPFGPEPNALPNCATPRDAGADNGTRTHDLLITNQPLYQLSYIGKSSNNNYSKPFDFCPALTCPFRNSFCRLPSTPSPKSSALTWAYHPCGPARQAGGTRRGGKILSIASSCPIRAVSRFPAIPRSGVKGITMVMCNEWGVSGVIRRGRSQRFHIGSRRRPACAVK